MVHEIRDGKMSEYNVTFLLVLQQKLILVNLCFLGLCLAAIIKRIINGKRLLVNIGIGKLLKIKNKK